MRNLEVDPQRLAVVSRAAQAAFSASSEARRQAEELRDELGRLESWTERQRSAAGHQGVDLSEAEAKIERLRERLAAARVEYAMRTEEAQRQGSISTRCREYAEPAVRAQARPIEERIRTLQLSIRGERNSGTIDAVNAQIDVLRGQRAVILATLEIE